MQAKNTSKPRLVRDFYRVQEVSEMTGFSVLDLFHLGEKGEIDILLIVENFETDCIFGFLPSYDEDKDPKYKALLDSPYVMLTSEELEELRLTDPDNYVQSIEVTEGRSIISGKKTFFGEALSQPITGAFPVADLTLRAYSYDREMAYINLSANKLSKEYKDYPARYAVPKRRIHMDEALDKGALLVSKTDLAKLLNQPILSIESMIGTTDASESGHSKAPLTAKENLGKLGMQPDTALMLIALLARKYNYSLEKNDFATSIIGKALSSREDAPSENTIRSALRRAATAFPDIAFPNM